MSRNECKCGHPWHHHEHVRGHTFAPSVIVTHENGERMYGLPDVWVCSGDHDPPDLGPDASPWDYVCGCVLYSPPPLVVS